MGDSIPKIIHYCWFGPKKIPILTRLNILKWRLKLKDYKFMLWTEANTDIDSVLYIKKAYSEKKWAFVSDYVRMYALFKYGGIYLDTDVKILKKFDPLLSLNAFMSFESNDTLCTAVIGAKPQNYFIKKMVEYYKKYSTLEEDKFIYSPNSKLTFNYLRLMEDFEPGVFFQTDYLTVFPKEYFSPIDYYTRKKTLTKDTYAIHMFDGSWLPKKYRITRLKSLWLRLRSSL